MPSEPAVLPRALPEDVGIPSSAVQSFLTALEEVGGPHSVMIARRGRVAVEGWWAPYAPDLRHLLFSLSKSFASTAVGLAVSEGLLSVDDAVVSFFPDRLPERVCENLAAMRVRHLLTMTTGQHGDPTEAVISAPDGDWVRAFLAQPVEHAPGTWFVYNSAATYMCSAIVQQRTGQTLVEYLTPRLFQPLGIENPAWSSCPRGINVGGWGLSITTESILRFGLLYLGEGRWNGRQVVPADWVRAATSKQVPSGEEGEASDWTQGYGYQFWRCRHGGFRGDGAFGQFCVVMPEQEMVVALTGGHADLQGALDAVWDHLLPALDAGGSAAGGPALRERLTALEVPTPEGAATAQTADRVSGNTYRLDGNDAGYETAEFVFTPDSGVLSLRGAGFEHRIESGHGRWAPGHLPGEEGLARLGAPPVGIIRARGAWTDADTYTMTVCYVETPFIETIVCRFAGDGVTVARSMNVGFGEPGRYTLAGRVA